MGNRLEASILDIAGVPIEFLRGGRGKPLLVLHGGDEFRPDDPFLGALTERNDIIVPTHPGFGRAVLPDWVDGVDDIAHLYLALLDRLALSRIDLVGMSFGGWIAAEMATKALSLVDRLVLVSPVGIKIGPVDRLDIPEVFATAPEVLQRLQFHDPGAHAIDVATLSDDELTIMMRNRETLALMTWEPYMHNPKLKHRLPSCRSETLLLRGESDGLVSAGYLAGYAACIPGARTGTIARAAHLPHREQPAALIAAVRAFLDR